MAPRLRGRSRLIAWYCYVSTNDRADSVGQNLAGSYPEVVSAIQTVNWPLRVLKASGRARRPGGHRQINDGVGIAHASVPECTHALQDLIQAGIVNVEMKDEAHHPGAHRGCKYTARLQERN